ncbi:MAG: rRNA maturation RNase YbeY [Proteobacteria bacterium]|nr:rRNA maturation RNase YbeY [Pseudomonadota bacterium]
MTAYIIEMISHNKYNIEIEINKQLSFRKFRNFDATLFFAIQKALELTKHSIDVAYNISLLLCDDEYISQLNAQYRQKNYATNVLSFEDGEVMDDVKFLGDIAISIPTITQEAAEQGKTFRTHFIHMFVHGALHLLGFDHQTPQEVQIMEAMEDEILLHISQ